MKTKPVILVFSEYYRPGYKSGGGMRTIVNMVDRLSDRYHFRVVTQDHDGPNDVQGYSHLPRNTWTAGDTEEVYYVARPNLTLATVRQLVKEIEPDLIYSNSFFSKFTFFLMLLRRSKAIGKTPFVLAPCGELAAEALAIKGTKKRSYLALSSVVRLYSGLLWKASSTGEVSDIAATGVPEANIVVAPDITPRSLANSVDLGMVRKKRPGEVKIVFVSRLAPKKNLDFLLRVLSSGIEGKVQLEVVGPEEDSAYAKQCRSLAGSLRENITVNFRGPVPHDQIDEVLRSNHFFVLPTLNENFGHVILEALSQGCPAIISDRTPWDQIESAQCGWSIPLENPERWLQIINRCAFMANSEYLRMSRAATAFANMWMADDSHLQATVDLLERALSKAVVK